MNTRYLQRRKAYAKWCYNNYDACKCPHCHWTCSASLCNWKFCNECEYACRFCPEFTPIKENNNEL